MSANLPVAQGAKATGSFYTPDTLAAVLAEWLVRPGPQILLEPSAGEGALVEAALNRARAIGGDISFLACDINGDAIDLLRRKLSAGHLCVTCDFLDLESESSQKFDGILANPPFTRNHAIDADRRAELRRRFQVEGAAGLWVHFLFHACSFLKPGGRIAAIVPAAALFTNYGRIALSRISEKFSSVELRQITDRPRWVNGAEERGALLLADGYQCGSSTLPTPTRWSSTGFLMPTVHAGNPVWLAAASEASVPFRTLASVSIGAVTGRNAIFLLNEDDRLADGIPRAHVRPIASRARHVRGLLLSVSDLETLATQGEPTWLLAPANLDRQEASGARKRLSRIGSKDRRKIVWLNKRSPWWSVDAGADCDAIFTYMNDGGPRLVLTDVGVTCSNTLHRVQFKDVSRPVRESCAVSMLSTFGQLSAELAGRQYGGGVLKFELTDLRQMPVLVRQTPIKKHQLKRLDELMRSGRQDEARRVADSLLLPDIFGDRWKEAADAMGLELHHHRAQRKEISID